MCRPSCAARPSAPRMRPSTTTRASTCAPCCAPTITQQLVKNTLLGPQQTAERKIKEAFLAMELTRRYSKDEILEMYLNEIFYGNHAYGIEAAAETYFGKRVNDLTLAEASLLAGLPQAPAFYDPYTNLPAARERQQYVLDQMVR